MNVFTLLQIVHSCFKSEIGNGIGGRNFFSTSRDGLNEMLKQLSGGQIYIGISGWGGVCKEAEEMVLELSANCL